MEGLFPNGYYAPLIVGGASFAGAYAYAIVNNGNGKGDNGLLQTKAMTVGAVCAAGAYYLSGYSLDPTAVGMTALTSVPVYYGSILGGMALSGGAN